jgi:hypothetical protein
MKKILIVLLLLAFNVGYARDFSQAELSIVNVTTPEINGFSDRVGWFFGLIGSLVEQDATKEKHTNQVNKNVDADLLIQAFIKGLEYELNETKRFKSIKVLSKNKDAKHFQDWYKNEDILYSFDQPETSDFICEFGIYEFTLHKELLGDVITATAGIKIIDKKTKKIIVTARDFSVQYPPSIKDDAPVEETKKIFDDSISKIVKIITKGVVEKIDFDKIN